MQKTNGMATISTNDIIVNYKLGDVSALTQLSNQFQKITQEEEKVIKKAKEVNEEIKRTGTEGANAGKGVETAMARIAGPLNANRQGVAAFVTQLKAAGVAAQEAANKAKAGFSGAEANTKAASAAARTFATALGGISAKPIKEVAQAATQAKTSFEETKNQANNFAGSLKTVGPLIASAFSVAAISAFASKVIDTTIAFQGYQKAIEFGSGSAENYAKNQSFLTETINKFGLDLRTTTEAYKQFFTASTLAGQSQEETNKQFLAVTKAGTVLKLTTDQMQGAFLALGQMMSKGTVQAEELRGQLGERIPGAFSLMAKALNVNERQLNKMLEQGQVLSRDALPKFAAELEKTFGPQAEKNLNGLVNSQNRFNSAIDGLVLAIGNKLEPFLKGSYDLAAGIAKQLAGIGNQAKKQTTENIALKRVEAELAQSMVKYGGDATVSNMKYLRQQEGVLLLIKLQERIEKQMNDNARFRQAAAGAFNTTAKLNLKAGENELAVLKQMEAEYTKIIGLDIVAPKQEAKEMTKEDLKLLKEQYSIRLKQLELEKQYRTLQGELAGDPIARFAAERQYLEKLTKLKQEFAAKGMDISKMEITVTGLEAKKAGEEQVKQEAKQQLQTLDGIKAFNDKRNAEMDKAAKAEEERRTRQMNATKAANEAELQAAIDLEKRKAEARQELQQQVYDFIVTNTNAIFELQSQYAAAEMAQKNRQFDEEIRLADGNVQKITEIEEKRRQAEKEYREKEFRANQMQAIANAIFTAAPYIIKYTSGLPVTAGNLALTLGALAAQTGFILAQPMPEFAKGVENFEGGPAIVGEQGRELVRTDKGLFLTPDKATMTYLPKGSDVITAPKTRELLQGNSTFLNRQNQWTAIDTAPIAQAIKAIPVQSLEISERGLERYVTKGNRTTKILNKQRGAKL